MNQNTSPVVTAAATLAVGAALNQAQAASVSDLVEQLKSKDDQVRGKAWQAAGPCGAPAVKPLAELMQDAEMETARSAKRAIYQIIRYAGRPGAEEEARAVEAELISGLQNPKPSIRREILWMISEIGGDNSVEPAAALLKDSEVREDARCALQRIPGAKSLRALKTALTEVPEDFRFNIADSLRKRGEPITDYPSKKLVPTKS